MRKWCGYIQSPTTTVGHLKTQTASVCPWVLAVQNQKHPCDSKPHRIDFSSVYIVMFFNFISVIIYFLVCRNSQTLPQTVHIGKSVSQSPVAASKRRSFTQFFHSFSFSISFFALWVCNAVCMWVCELLFGLLPSNWLAFLFELTHIKRQPQNIILVYYRSTRSILNTD